MRTRWRRIETIVGAFAVFEIFVVDFRTVLLDREQQVYMLGRVAGSSRHHNWILSIGTAAVYLFLYTPILVLVVLSFNDSRYGTTWRGFTWRWYELAWNDPTLAHSLRNSLIVAFATTAIAAVIGTAAAMALARYRLRFRSGIEGLIILPLIIPEIVMGFATAAFFGAVGLAFGFSTIVAAHVAFSISLVTFLVRARLSGLPQSYDEAAMDLGATSFQTYSRVTIPLLAPAIVAASLLVFTISLDNYLITSFVAGPGSTTLPMKIYSMIKTGVTPQINAISTVLLLVTLLFILVASRLSSGRPSRWAPVAVVVGFSLLAFFAIGGQGRATPGGVLNVYIWSNYLPESVVAEFERRFDARLNVEVYDSNEALLAKLQAGGARYDIIVPSDYLVAILREQGLIDRLDLDRIANFSNLDPRFTGMRHDPRNEYSVPYLWGTTGIGYRRDRVSEPVDSWSVFFDAGYAGRLALLDDVREVIGIGLRLRGYSINSTDPEHVIEAGRMLMDQKPLVRAYDSGRFDELLLSGEAWIVQGYSGQIARAMFEDDQIGYAIPREGGTLFVDNLCIPRDAPRPDLALEFINFVLEAEIAAGIANQTGYSTPNRLARSFIAPAMLANEAAYPSKEQLERCELIVEIGEAISLYDRVWTELKSR